MGYLAAAAAVTGTGLVVNLALTFALIRRVLQHGAQLAMRQGGGRRKLEVPVGSQAPGFAVKTADGGIRTLGDLLGARSVIAFLSPGCPPCRRQIPDFLDYARTMPGGAPQVLAVFCTDKGAVGDLAQELNGAATIAVEPLRGTIQTAFSVSGFPTFYTLDASGRVAAGGMMVRDLTPAELV